MIVQVLTKFGAQCRRRFLQGVGKCVKEVEEFPLGPIEDITGEKSSSWTKFEDFEARRAVERTPHLFELAGEKASENGMNIAGGKEVPGFAELVATARIVTLDRMVEAEFHVARKRDWTAVANLLLDLLAEGQSDPSETNLSNSKS